MVVVAERDAADATVAGWFIVILIDEFIAVGDGFNQLVSGQAVGGRILGVGVVNQSAIKTALCCLHIPIAGSTLSHRCGPPLLGHYGLLDIRHNAMIDLKSVSLPCESQGIRLLLYSTTPGRLVSL